MRSLEDAQRCWAHLDEFTTLDDVRSYVKEHGAAGPNLSGLRSVCWKAFLLFNNLERATWSATLRDARSAYQSLREHFLRYIENPNELETTVDPLSESEESPWAALRKDEELRNEIYQDVERCMPENLYFRQPSTATMLLDILFIFCKLNPDIGYKQGMHEILAPLVWVVERDAVESGGEGKGTDDLLREMFAAEYVEHDCFTLFGLIMQGARPFYEVPGGDGKPTSGVRSPRASKSHDSPLLVRIRRIYDDHLRHVDPRLADHLHAGDVAPQLFMMKWLRLLFGREFPFDAVLGIWDALFAADPSLLLADYVCLAMILRLHWKLLALPPSQAITLLMRYPTTPDAATLVADAVQLRDHLTPETGVHLIALHTRRRPSIPLPPTPGSFNPSPATSPSIRPVRSPRPLLHRPAAALGFESLLQDAAKGVISRSEKWGLNQAVRDAMENLRSGVSPGTSPAGSPAPSHRRGNSSVSGRPGFLSPGGAFGGESKADAQEEGVSKRVKEVETRQKALAKLLETELAKLWDVHARIDGASDVPKETSDALAGSVGQIQLLHSCLVDGSMPLPDSASEKPAAEAKLQPPLEMPMEKGATDGDKPTAEIFAPTKSLTPDLPKDDPTPAPRLTKPPAPHVARSASPSKPTSKHTANPSSPSTARATLFATSTLSARPESFIAASPFESPRFGPSSSRRRNQASAFLFGEDVVDGGEENAQGKKAKEEAERKGELIGMGPLENAEAEERKN